MESNSAVLTTLSEGSPRYYYDYRNKKSRANLNEGLEIFTIVDNSLRQGSTCKLTLIDKPMCRDVDSDYDGDIPILLHLPISVIIEKSVNLTEKDIDFLKRLLDETIKEK